MAPELNADLPEDVRALVSEAADLHAGVGEAYQAYMSKIKARRAAVLKLKARGVSGYRLAHLLGVSETSIGNWVNGTKPKPPAKPRARARTK